MPPVRIRAPGQAGQVGALTRYLQSIFGNAGRFTAVNSMARGLIKEFSMIKSSAVAFCAVLLASSSTAAFAALDRIGSVVFTSVAAGQSEYRNFSGNEISLTARNSDLNCDGVVATFDNGRSRGIFAGHLIRGHEVAIALPHEGARVIRLDFNCHPMGGLGGVVDIAAGTDQLFADKSASQLAVNAPERGGWRAFFDH